MASARSARKALGTRMRAGKEIMIGVVRTRLNQMGQPEEYDWRCGDCVDFMPDWNEFVGDREATEEDSDKSCVYCGTCIHPAAAELEIPAVQYAEGFKFVTVYDTDRAYGGPEEGGWWYDTGVVVLCRQVPSEDAERVSRELREKYPRTDRRYSVIYPGTGDYDVVISDAPGADYPEYTPHYE